MELLYLELWKNFSKVKRIRFNSHYEFDHPSMSKLVKLPKDFKDDMIWPSKKLKM